MHAIEIEIFPFSSCGKGEKEVETLQLILTILFKGSNFLEAFSESVFRIVKKTKPLSFLSSFPQP